MMVQKDPENLLYDSELNAVLVITSNWKIASAVLGFCFRILLIQVDFVILLDIFFFIFKI